MTRPPLYMFLRDEEPDGEVRTSRKKSRDWALRRAEKRRREEWLDACSDPPDESTLYGESLVIDGERVGEWEAAETCEPDEVPLHPSHHSGVTPPSDLERERLAREQRAAARPARRVRPDSDAEDRERIRAELREMPVSAELQRRLNQTADARFRRRVEQEEARVQHEKREKKAATKAAKPPAWPVSEYEVLPAEPPPDIDAAVRRFDPDETPDEWTQIRLASGKAIWVTRTRYRELHEEALSAGMSFFAWVALTERFGIERS